MKISGESSNEVQFVDSSPDLLLSPGSGPPLSLDFYPHFEIIIIVEIIFITPIFLLVISI